MLHHRNKRTLGLDDNKKETEEGIQKIQKTSKAPRAPRAPREAHATQVTSLRKPGFDRQDVADTKPLCRMSFRCPVTIDSVFRPPTAKEVATFHESRTYGAETTPFQDLDATTQLKWTESFHDNKVLMGFIVYAQLFPKLLQSRIKLNTATYHWSHLDPASTKGGIKIEERRQAITRLRRGGVLASVFMGLSHTKTRTDKPKSPSNILQFMNIDTDDEDERYRFFAKREFSMIHAPRGQVGSSSVYTSCSMALSLLWFATAVLARPCCLESIVLPLSVPERKMMEARFGCPTHLFDGPLQTFHTNWAQVFDAVDTQHRNIDYTLLALTSQHKYVQGLYVADTYAIFKATITSPRDNGAITALVESYKQNSKHGFESGAIVGALDVIRDKPVRDIGKIDGGVLGAINMTYGQDASRRVQDQCTKLEGTRSSLFDTSVSNKLGEILTHFDQELWKARKKDKIERVIANNMDPAGMNKKIESGKMLDPTDPKSVQIMMDMLKALSRQVWRPLKALIGQALGNSLEFPEAFLQVSQEEERQLHQHAVDSHVCYTDIANLCTVLLLSLSFQRSQVLREATVDEFVIAPATPSCYKFTFKNRRFKTAASSGKTSAPPVSHFNLTSEQSMIVKFIQAVGHRICETAPKNSTPNPNAPKRLFVNTKGENWTQKDITSRFKFIGRHWLNIQNFGAHISRTFWATHALNSGQISGANIEDFSTFLQVSTSTLRNNYMSASANTAAHELGSEVLGAVMNAACTGNTTEKGARPYGKRLNLRRLEFVAEVRASLRVYNGNGRTMFRDLMQKREEARLSPTEKWFRYDNTYFCEGDERLFQRFVDKVSLSHDCQ